LDGRHTFDADARRMESPLDGLDGLAQMGESEARFSLPFSISMFVVLAVCVATAVEGRGEGVRSGRKSCQGLIWEKSINWSEKSHIQRRFGVCTKATSRMTR